MAKLKDLYDLCTATSKAERRFLNLYVQAMSGKAKDNYLLQLENLWQLKAYDENLLKAKMKNIKTKRISEFNTNLFHFISKAILVYQIDSTPSLSMLKDVMLSEVYMSKGLLNVTEDLLNNSFKENDNYANSEALLLIQKQQYKLGLKSYLSFEQQMELLDQKLVKLEAIKSETAYQKLNFEMNLLFSKFTLPRNKKQAQVFKDFLKQDLLKNMDLAKSNYAKHYYYMIKIPLLQIVGEGNKALELSNEAIDFAKKNFDLKKDSIPLFLQLKRNLSLLFSLEMSDKFISIINEIKDIIKVNPKLKGRIDIWSVELDAIINKAMIENEYKKGIQYFEKNAKDKLDIEFDKVNRLDAKALLISRIYFLNKDYNNALKYAELASQGEQYKFRYAIIASKFIVLLTHYKLGNHLLLPYATKSLHRELKKEETLYKPEKALLSFLGKIKNPDNIPKELQRLKTVFDKEIENPYNDIFFGNGDYLVWLDEEINL